MTLMHKPHHSHNTTDHSIMQTTTTYSFSYSFYNVAKNKMYSTFNNEDVHATCEMNPEVASYMSKTIATDGTKRFITTFDGCFPGIEFTINPLPNSTLSDLVNVWNANAVKVKKHVLAMDTDFSDSDYIFLTNTSDFTCHLWSGYFTYHGMWTPGECRRFPITDITSSFQSQISSSQSQISSSQSQSPIIVSQDMLLFDTTAYLYRRNSSNFYTKTDMVIAPAGFYKTPYALVATINACIGMRGERNGFIYNFIYDSATGLLGVEASHRQPEPSTMEITPLAPYFTASNVTLPLRTAKRIYFPLPMPFIF